VSDGCLKEKEPGSSALSFDCAVLSRQPDGLDRERRRHRALEEALLKGRSSLRIFNAIWLLALLALGGYVLALLLRHDAPPAGTPTATALAGVTQLERVTVTRPARTVVRRVAVVRHLHGQRVVSYVTRTVTTPGGTRVVTRPVVRYRRVVVSKVVTQGGRTTTVRQTLTRVQTVTQVQAQQVTSTLTQRSTVTVTRPITGTVVSTSTETSTQTVPTTVTVPVTVTVTVHGKTSPATTTG
jgi:hypothetical protein